MLETGTAAWQIHPMLAPLAGEAVIDKRTPDALHGTALGAALDGVTRLERKPC